MHSLFLQADKQLVWHFVTGKLSLSIREYDWIQTQYFLYSDYRVLRRGCPYILIPGTTKEHLGKQILQKKSLKFRFDFLCHLGPDKLDQDQYFRTISFVIGIHWLCGVLKTRLCYSLRNIHYFLSFCSYQLI